MTSLSAGVVAGLATGVLYALAFRRLTIRLLTARGSPLGFVGASALLRLVPALAGFLLLRHWGAGAACAGVLGQWMGILAVAGRAAAERSQ